MKKRTLASFSVLIFYFFVTFIFLLEGLGLRMGREMAFILILIAPFFLFLLDIINKFKIIIPRTLTLLYGGFLLFTAISSALSVNAHKSFLYLLFYSSLYLIFLYVLNHKRDLQKYLIIFIFVITIIFSLYSLFLNYFIQNSFYFLIPDNGYQYVFSRFGSHNHLGDILILPLIISLYYLIAKKNQVLSFGSLIYYFPLFLFAYSRTAYFAFVSTILVMIVVLLKRHSVRITKFFTVLIVLVILASSILFFTSVRESREVPILKSITQILQSNFGLQNKLFFANRHLFTVESIRSISEKPFFGVGPGNYYVVSERFQIIPGLTSESSHNLIFDVMVENGLLAGVLFVFFVGLIFFRINKSTVVFYLLMGVSIVFQFDYAHRIHSLLFFLFILLGLQSDSWKGSYYSGKIAKYGVVALLLFVFIAVQYLLLANLDIL